MTKDRWPGARPRMTWLVIGLSAALAGCVAESTTQRSEQISTQPRRATYDCGTDGSIVVDNMRSMVTLTDSEGSYQLAAAPPNQSSRYGSDGYALVLEGNDALWMKAGSTPLTCRRQS